MRAVAGCPSTLITRGRGPPRDNADYARAQPDSTPYRTPLCSFECLINFAVARIRERREHHNQQLITLRKALRESQGTEDKALE
jgi:hypothetical protein